MKDLAKNIGVLVMIIGVLILVIPFLQNGMTSNTTLLIGMLVVIEGFIGHIFVNNLKNTKVGNIVWMVALLVVPYFIFLFAKKTAYSDQIEGL